MGGLFSSRVPTPPPAPARPVTAVTKTPELELDETEVVSEQLTKKKKGKKALRTDVTKDTATQVASAGSGLNIPKGQ